MTSAVQHLGIGVIMPDAVENARNILRVMERNVHSPVVVLRFDQRRLSEHEAFRLLQGTRLSQLSADWAGGGFNPEGLRKGLEFYLNRMKRLQEEDVVIVAFDNWLERESRLIEMVQKEAWEGISRPEWDFDCATGKRAHDFTYLFPRLIWEEVEKAAKESQKSHT